MLARWRAMLRRGTYCRQLQLQLQRHVTIRLPGQTHGAPARHTQLCGCAKTCELLQLRHCMVAGYRTEQCVWCRQCMWMIAMEVRITMTTHQRDAHGQPHKRERKGARWRAGAQCWFAVRKPLRHVYDYGSTVKQTCV